MLQSYIEEIVKEGLLHTRVCVETQFSLGVGLEFWIIHGQFRLRTSLGGLSKLPIIL